MIRSVALALIASLPVIAADEVVKPAALMPEPEVIEGKPVKVRSNKELPIQFPLPEGTKTIELWYRSNDGRAWASWQKHGISFDKDTPIVWAAPEGHWQIYVNPVLTSNLSRGTPSETTKADTEIIIDRTAPVVTIGFPGVKEKLRGGDRYTVKWDAQDGHLRSNPISVRWSRDGKGSWETVAEGVPNSGSYEWTVPRDNTNAGVLRIEAADKATNVGSAEITGLMVDSIRPKGRVIGPAISAKADLNVEIDVKDEGPAGLENAQLWFSTDDGVSWTQGPYSADAKTVPWKAPGDGRYRMAIVARDKAGANALRDFKPGDKVQVPFVVKEINPIANSVTIYLQTDAAAPWKEVASKLPADQTIRFDIPAVETKQARIKVSAVDAAGNIGETTASETFTIQTKVDVGPVEIKLDL